MPFRDDNMKVLIVEQVKKIFFEELINLFLAKSSQFSEPNSVKDKSIDCCVRLQASNIWPQRKADDRCGSKSWVVFYTVQ